MLVTTIIYVIIYKDRFCVNKINTYIILFKMYNYTKKKKNYFIKNQPR